ncbi:MAG: class I SAM-dependent methyltransferase [Bacteroidota bacterium]
MTNKVRDYYNNHAKEEEERLDFHAFELPVTMHYISRYLPPGSKILDIACGTGRYAEALLEQDYLLGLNDISDQNIRFVKEKFGNNENILFMERSDARTSMTWQREKWDGILLLGPLYHLQERKERLGLLKMAEHYVQKGGVVFSAFMTRTGALIYGLKNNPGGILNEDGTKKLWEQGHDETFIEKTEHFENSYFSNPAEIHPLIEEARLTPLHLIGIEGIFGERFELYHNLPVKEKEAWLKFIIKNGEEQPIIHNSKHMLSVSTK